VIELMILVTSSRPGRAGPSLAQWVEPLARAHGEFRVNLVDLAELNLPFMDEPNHPMKKDYQHEHTKAWSRMVEASDAFLVVAAEYNFGFTAVFKNAIDYLYQEWKNKPVAFVGYGGVAGGTRSIQMMKSVLTSLDMMPVNDAVYLPFFRNQLDAAGQFVPTEEQNKAAAKMLKSLARWAVTLRPLRSPGA